MTTQDWLDTFISWLPVIFIAAVFVIFMIRMRRMAPLQKEALELSRRNNAVLERILAILESKEKK